MSYLERKSYNRLSTVKLVNQRFLYFIIEYVGIIHGSIRQHHQSATMSNFLHGYFKVGTDQIPCIFYVQISL